MHDDARRHNDAQKKKNKQSKKGIFRAVTMDTTNKGSCPEIHTHVGRRVG
jgi:hypothetical protein